MRFALLRRLPHPAVHEWTIGAAGFVVDIARRHQTLPSWAPLPVAEFAMRREIKPADLHSDLKASSQQLNRRCDVNVWLSRSSLTGFNVNKAQQHTGWVLPMVRQLQLVAEMTSEQSYAYGQGQRIVRTADFAATESVADLLRTVPAETRALVIEGETGIGKTTLWLQALESARSLGFHVLLATGAVAESVLAYSALADLLSGVDAVIFDGLPYSQRVAVDRVLLRSNENSAATDQYAVASAFLSILQALTASAPLLLGIDDIQWLDQSSARVIEFVARRLVPGMGLLATVRIPPVVGSTVRLELPAPEAIQRIRLQPLDLDALHVVLVQRLGRSYARPVLSRIHDVSGGNPLYALELARFIDETHDEVSLPGSLAELVDTRIGEFSDDIHRALLTVACLATPTVDVVARALRVTPRHLLRMLAPPEDDGILTIEGSRIAFSHPLLRHGAYSRATPSQRREIHHRLASLVDHPELHARHLALAATSAETRTVQALDDAAASARMRGAPDAAAELLNLAAQLGDETPERRIRCAASYFDAGDSRRARDVLLDAMAHLPAGPLRAEARWHLALTHLLGDSVGEAVDQLRQATVEAGDNAELVVRCQALLAFALMMSGGGDEAYTVAVTAAAQAESLGRTDLLAAALGVKAVLGFMAGNGFDRDSIIRALELEGDNLDLPLPLRPSLHHGLLLAFTGDLEQADEVLSSMSRRWIEYGCESETAMIAWNSSLVAMWRANFVEVASLAADTIRRAHQLDSDLTLFVGQVIHSGLAAYLGREEEARQAFTDAARTGERCGAHMLAQLPLAYIGFLEVSSGDYESALTTLSPLIDAFEAIGSTEITAAPYLPDAIEALIGTGQLAAAKSMIETVAHNGRRLDRPWMLAIGARGCAMLLAAQGDVESAIAAAQEALAEHARLPMPFETARTQLLLGQLLRRERKKAGAARILSEALMTFEELGTAIWAERARCELARAKVVPSPDPGLTPSEKRVAELVTSGMTNRAVASALLISPKTVDVYLSRIYRKLEIHSRAELGRIVGVGQ
jgi:DNA-binding NarL/FixJ family response regulator